MFCSLVFEGRASGPNYGHLAGLRPLRAAWQGGKEGVQQASYLALRLPVQACRMWPRTPGDGCLLRYHERSIEGLRNLETLPFVLTRVANGGVAGALVLHSSGANGRGKHFLFT